MGEPVIEIDSLKFSYVRTVNVLDIESINIFRGDKVVLIGPNGSGKSTLIRILMGFLPNYSGDVYVLGYRPETLPTRYRVRIGYTPESPTLPKDVAARDYLNLVADIRGDRGYRDVVQYLRIEEVMDKRLSELSMGFKRRVMIAASLIGEPEIIFMDEPFTNIDIESRFYIEYALSRLLEGSTYLISTHSLPFTISSKGILLLQGRLVAVLDDVVGGFKAWLRFGNERVVVDSEEEVLKLLDDGYRLEHMECNSIYRIFKDYFMGK